MTATHAPRLTASTVSALVRRAIGAGNAKVSTGSQIEQDGALVTVSVSVMIHGAKAAGTDRDLLGRAVAAAALQAGYEVGGASSVLTITLPEPAEVDEVAPAVVVEQDAPRQDLDGEFRHEATCTPDPAACTCTPRYWTAEEVAAERRDLALLRLDPFAVAAAFADAESERRAVPSSRYAAAVVDGEHVVVDTMHSGHVIGDAHDNARKAAGHARYLNDGYARIVVDADHSAALVADAILDARPALAAIRPGVLDEDAPAELEARPLLPEEREAFSAGVDLVRPVLAGRFPEPDPEVDDPREQPEPVEWSEVARPAHVPASVPDAEVDRYLDAYPYPGA